MQHLPKTTYRKQGLWLRKGLAAEDLGISLEVDKQLSTSDRISVDFLWTHVLGVDYTWHKDTQLGHKFVTDV